MQQQKIQHTWRDKANEETRYIISEFSKGMWSTSKEKQASLNNKIEKGLVSSSAVKSTSCSCRELHLGSLHSHNSSWLSELLLLGLLMPSSVVLKHCMPVVHIDTHRQNINVHKVKISKFFFFTKRGKHRDSFIGPTWHWLYLETKQIAHWRHYVPYPYLH